MNRDQARELLPIIQAFAEGKTVQSKHPLEKVGEWGWFSQATPSFTPTVEWRIKPEPREWVIDVHRDGDLISNHVCMNRIGIAETIKVREVLSD